MMVIDFDEYFVPQGKTKNILSYARSLIKEKIGSVILSRQDYYCKTVERAAEMPIDGNLTNLYNTTKSVHHRQGKSIHLVKAVLQNSVHRSGPLLPPYTRSSYKESQHKAQCYITHLVHFSTHIPPQRFKKICGH